MNTVVQYPASITILPDLTASGCDELLKRLSEVAVKDAHAAKCGVPAEKIFELIKAREEQSSTAVGGGLMLPHIRLAGLEQLVVVFGRFAEPFAGCETPDEIPLDIVCLLLVPEENPVEGLRFMADLGGCIRTPAKRTRLFAAQDADELREVLAEQRTQTHTLVAADIMIPARVFATPGMQLKEATRLMAESHQEIIPVLDGKKLVGELSSVELFKLGIPDFFSQLKSVGFIRYFDPFEKYFAVEAASRVEDVMNRELPSFHPDATLIEVVFAISVLKQPVIYVTNHKQELQGVISQAQLLGRIINL